MSSYYSLLVLRMTPPPDCVVATQEGGSSVMRAALWGSEPWLLTGNAVRIDLKKDLPRVRYSQLQLHVLVYELYDWNA
jgi:hypothetical protein